MKTNRNNKKAITNRSNKKAITTFKQIRIQEENCQQILNKEFNQINIKVSAIQKLAALTFQTTHADQNSIVHQLLQDYKNSRDYFNQILQCRNLKIKSTSLGNKQGSKCILNKHNLQTSSAHKKSQALILQLQNKKLNFKLKMLTKKYRQSKLLQRPQKNEDQYKKQKNLLKQQLSLLEDVKNLKRQINSAVHWRAIYRQTENRRQKQTQKQIKIKQIQKNRMKQIQKNKQQNSKMDQAHIFMSGVQTKLKNNQFIFQKDLLKQFQTFMNSFDQVQHN